MEFEAIKITNGTVEIDGGGHAILDGHGNSDSTMFIIDGGTLIVKGVTLQNGGSAVRVRSGSATFSSCSFVKNIVDYDGGAVSVGGGSATFSSCSFVSNTAGGRDGHGGYGGAAVVSGDGSTTFSSCSFINNTATGDIYGGGAVFVTDMSEGSATFSSCSFVNNTAANGGAVFVMGPDDGGTDLARIVNCSFEADGSGTDSGANGIGIHPTNPPVPVGDGNVTFGCPTGTTGADVPMPGRGLGTSQLPPAKQIISCH
jgi:predicted outer membrane repeat protein